MFYESKKKNWVVFKSLLSLRINGIPVGMLKFDMSSSDILFKYLIRARREFPCATIRAFFPDFMNGAISWFQIGSSRFNVSFRLSVDGISSSLSFLYRLSKRGCLLSLRAKGGGDTLKLLRQLNTFSSPCNFTDSDLFNPSRSP